MMGHPYLAHFKKILVTPVEEVDVGIAGFGVSGQVGIPVQRTQMVYPCRFTEISPHPAQQKFARSQREERRTQPGLSSTKTHSEK